ncbi:hypothetical protein PHYPSEUDO_013993 [Phytophthora pseudosyringae]|uniref:Uncharacterized protein n=1 Tax=Phytophthora pseudosyringae TaxID=221518 RepID=A0A8T1V5N7_9STRA|nr:hypothetical protein PHYPSEUDO_013993 [Phytophthora pseudosyringae]
MTNEGPTCSAVFIRAACPHGRLFESEYKRCFPHCCPQHVDRSYCGSSFELLVRFTPESDVSQSTVQRGQQLNVSSFDENDVFVFARFETLSGGNLPATNHTLRYLRSVSQSEVNQEASWIEGVRQRPTDGQQSSQQLGGRQLPARALARLNAPRSATFVLNAQPYAKWCYHWGSGANKVQRSTQHVLKAYVFYLPQRAKPMSFAGLQAPRQHVHQAVQSVDERTLEMLCVVTSPPFTVVSYRRASEEVQSCRAETDMDGAALTLPHYPTGIGHPAESDLRRLVQRHISRAFMDYTLQHRPDQEAPEPSSHFQAEDQDSASFQRFGEHNGHLLGPPTLQDAGLLGCQSQEPRLAFSRSKQSPPSPVQRDTAISASSCEDKAAPLDVATGTSRKEEGVMRSVMLQLVLQQRQMDAHQRELQQLTDLAVIHLFASRVKLTAASDKLQGVLTRAIGEHWHYSRSEAMHLAETLRSVSQGGGGARCHDDYDSQSKLEELTLLLIEVCVWTFSSENYALARDVLTASYPLLLRRSGGGGDGRTELREAFLGCIGRCWARLNAFLQNRGTTGTIPRSVQEFSDAIIGEVHCNPKFEDLRLEIRRMLQRPTIRLVDSTDSNSSMAGSPRYNLLGWESFVAQVREGYLREQSPVPGVSLQILDAKPSRWNAEWLLQPASLSVCFHNGSKRFLNERRPAHQPGAVQLGHDVPSTWSLCLATSQLLHLKLATTGDPLHTFHVQAKPSVLSEESAWLRLICDGRLRVAPLTPNGLTSLMGGAACGFNGDYMAYCLQDAATNSSEDGPICFELYSWPTVEISQTALQFEITLKAGANGACIEAQMTLQCGSVELGGAQAPQLECLTPAERLQTVASWQPWFTVASVYQRN